MVAHLEFTPLSGKIVGGYVIATGLPAAIDAGVQVFGGNKQQIRINESGQLAWYFPTDTTTLNRIDITLTYLTAG